MKNRKLLKTWGLLASTTMLVPLVAGSLGGGPVAEAAPLNTTTDIVINKVVYDVNALPEGVGVNENGQVTGEKENDGSLGTANNFFGNAKRLDEVEFTMYDVTDKYWSTLGTENGDDGTHTMDTTFEAIKTGGTSELTKIDVQKTKDGGKATFENVPDYAQEGDHEGKNSVYLIAETDAPPFTANWSVPIVVMLPFYNEESEKIDVFNLFPKNTETGIDKSLNPDQKTEKTVNMPDPDNEGQMISVSVYDYEKGMDINYDIEFMVPLNINADIEDNGKITKLYTRFTIVDTPTENLGFKELANKAIEVYDSEKEEWVSAELEENIDYTLSKNTDDTGFTVTFSMEQATLTKLGTHAGKQMRINYTMTLLTDSTPLQFEDNEATVNFTHNGNPYHDTDEGEPVIPGGRHFYKYDGSKAENSTSVAGAEFVVGKTVDNETTYAVFKNEDGDPLDDERVNTSTVGGAASIEWTTDKEAATRIISAADGKFSVDALEYGNYFVEEIKAASGFVLPNDPITDFEVSATSFADTVNNPDEVQFADPEEIANYPKGTLPSTGGTGIFAFLAIGTALMMGAYLWFKNSKKQEV